VIELHPRDPSVSLLILRQGTARYS